MSIISDLRANLSRSSNTVGRLIAINVVVFLVAALAGAIAMLSGGSINLNTLLQSVGAMPADVARLATHPWAPITYQFLHGGFFHLLGNMLVFYWFGQIYTNFQPAKKVTWIYLLGGIAGAAMYLFAFNVFPGLRPYRFDGTVIGASAAVYAVMVATATLVPDYTMNLILIGEVKIKYIVVFVLLLDLVNLASANAGGVIAHFGGAAFGYLYTILLQNGTDLLKPFLKASDAVGSFGKPKQQLRVSYRAPQAKATPQATSNLADQKVIDAILDKISLSGYDSLTAREKQLLEQASRQ